MVKSDVYELYGVKVEEVEKLGGYGDKFNFIVTSKRDKFVFKTKFCKRDPIRDQLLGEVTSKLRHSGFVVPTAVKRRHEVENEDIKIFRYIVSKGLSPSIDQVSDELLSFVPGPLLAFAKLNADQLDRAMFKFGMLLAMLDKQMQEFTYKFESTVDELPNPFFMHHCLLARDKLPLVAEEGTRLMVKRFLDEFERKVLPCMSELKKGLIHGDLNDLNITIISPLEHVTGSDVSHDVIKSCFGVFDFEDAHVGSHVFELAVCLAYVIVRSRREERDDVWGTSAQLIAGHARVRPLTEIEFSVLYACVAARLCVSYLQSLSHPPATSNSLLFFHSELCLPCLRLMRDDGEEKITGTWKAAAAR